MQLRQELGESAPPAPSWARSASGSVSRMRRAATAPRASTRGRRPPPSSGRRSPWRRAPGAVAISSSASRLLPMPGSPTRRTSRPRPAKARHRGPDELGELAPRVPRRRRGEGSRCRFVHGGVVERRILAQDRLAEAPQLAPGSIPSSSARPSAPGTPPAPPPGAGGRARHQLTS